MSDCLWRIDGERAELPGFGLSLDLARPELGSTASWAPEHSVLGIRPAATGARFPLTDAYCRGPDVVARYGECEAFPCRTEVYWRSMGARDQTPTRPKGLQMIVSVETDLLDTYPELLVTSRFAPSGSGTSYAEGLACAPVSTVDLWCEAVHPTDLAEATHEWRQEPSFDVSQWRLFARFLEKGVIRRARLAGALLPAGEEGAAERWRQEFAEQPIPLTV